MKKALPLLAILGNIALILFALWLVVERGSFMRGGEAFLLLLLVFSPLLNLLVLGFWPDREERKLAKEVRKATLRLRLQRLAEGKLDV